jgi:hypothetical protein
MPTTLRNTDILFNDGSTQSTAAAGGGGVPANLAIGSIAMVYNFSRNKYNQGDTLPSANVGYVSASATGTYSLGNTPFAQNFVIRAGNVTVPGSPIGTDIPTTTALPGTWRSLSAFTPAAYYSYENHTRCGPGLAIRIA